ncbi:MAG: NAD(P)H-binding protein [Bryobacterales bacterium]|nr:NAD(P)H-binding protein [Acidobacteriota bacterium]MCB9384052.1 NAD(P)H-binding protein [Bryobacterales bacterium]
MEKTLVIGSTGNVGGAVVRELVEAGLSVRAATRNPSAMNGMQGVETVLFDFEAPETYAPALDGVDRVFAIGPPVASPESVLAPFLEQAAEGARKVVLMTAMGVEYDEEGPLRRCERVLERSGAPYVILRPNWFLDNFHSSWLDPIRSAGVLPLPAGDARTSFIDTRDIAACARVALEQDRFDGRAFTLTGPEALSYAQAAAALSEASGRAIRYAPVDDETFIASMTQAGEPRDLARYLAGLFAVVRAGGTAEVSPAVEEITGRRGFTIAQYARDHADAWQAAEPAYSS